MADSPPPKRPADPSDGSGSPTLPLPSRPAHAGGSSGPPTVPILSRPHAAGASRTPSETARTLVPGAEGVRTHTPLEGKPFGRYRLLEELGHGGMGIVWKAWDTELKRVVALKQILAGGAIDEGQVERFMREARLAAKLRHPAIVAVHDVGVHQGQHFFTSD